MMRALSSWIAVLGLPGWLLAGEPGRARVDYVQDVKPIIARRRLASPGPVKQKSGLRLDTAAALKKGGDGGPAIVAGQGDESLLIDAVTGNNGWRMPPEGEPLSAREVDLLRAWVN